LKNKREEVFTFIKQNKLDVINNHLYTYLAANLANNDQQSAYVQRIIQQKNNSEDYLAMPVGTSKWAMPA